MLESHSGRFAFGGCSGKSSLDKSVVKRQIRRRDTLRKIFFHPRILFPSIPFFPPIPSTTVDESAPVSSGTALRAVVFQAPLFFFPIH